MSALGHKWSLTALFHMPQEDGWNSHRATPLRNHYLTIRTHQNPFW
jgi:hypothetical protein